MELPSFSDRFYVQRNNFEIQYIQHAGIPSEGYDLDTHFLLIASSTPLVTDASRWEGGWSAITEIDAEYFKREKQDHT